MIIHFDKQTGHIVHVTEGRVHHEHEQKVTVSFSDNTEVGRLDLTHQETLLFEKLFGRHSAAINLVVVLDSAGKLKGFKNKPIPEPPKPNSVETVVIDLTRPLQELENEFAENTRRYVKQASSLSFRECGFSDRDQAGVLIAELEDRKDIHIGQQLLRNRAAFIDGFYRMYFVENAQEVLAMCIVQTNFKRMIYKVAAVSPKGRELHAGDKLVYELLKDAKQLGFVEFDFGGLMAQWTSEQEQQINIFKKRFGGKVVATVPLIAQHPKIV